MNVPILKNHNPSLDNVIGMFGEDGVITMKDGHELTEEQLFSTFGNVGIKVYDMVDRGDGLKIRKFKIDFYSITK